MTKIDKEKLAQYKRSLKRPYRGLTDDLRDLIDGVKVKENLGFDLNNDGVFDAKDKSIAAKALRKKIKKVKE